MANVNKSTALYSHPFSKAYWRDAAAELKDVKMLVITALMIALRIALKPFAIYIGPQMAIQTATLATALGAMIFGPVMAIPAAIISDTIGFMIFPTGDYFLPFVLTEIASTMFYALCLYRAKPNATRVIIARFLICFVVNVVMQQFIFAWQYTYMGNPDKAKDAIMGIMTAARLFKNLFFFPIESIVITLFLKVLIPVSSRAKLTYGGSKGLDFTKKQIAVLVVLLAVGICSSVGYLNYYYNNNSVTKDYSAEEVVEISTEDVVAEVAPEILNSSDPELLNSYFIVGGSFQSEASAEKCLTGIKNQGFENASILDKNDKGYIRVYYESFAEKSDALIRLNEIKSKYNESAWLLFQK